MALDKATKQNSCLQVVFIFLQPLRMFSNQQATLLLQLKYNMLAYFINHILLIFLSLFRASLDASVSSITKFIRYTSETKLHWEVNILI